LWVAHGELKNPAYQSGVLLFICSQRLVELPPVLLLGVVEVPERDPDPLVPEPVVSSFFI
jgi:hypothetical protein